MSVTVPARRRGTVRFAATVLAYVVLLAAVGALLVAVVVPRLTGSTPYTVLTGSMSPHVPAGSLVVTRPVDPSTLRVGDVITYQLRSGRPTVVTHRISAMGVNARGERLITTQGDANDVPDAAPVRDVQVRGVVWYHVPYLGRVNSALDGSQRRLAVQVVAGGLLLYAAWMFGGAARARRRATASSTQRDDEEKEEVAP